MAAAARDEQVRVSCLMVTLPVPERLAGLKRSLAGYLRQTWAERELVVVLDRGTDAGRAAVRRQIEALGREDVRIVEPPEQLSLGALRNIGWRAASGEMVCNWDDDDLHHHERLERQARALLATDRPASFLSEVMQYFPAERRLLLTNWAGTPLAVMPASMICRRSAPVVYPETGPQARIGEDLAVLEVLKAHGGLHGLAGSPHLYVYVSNGLNTGGPDHHGMIADRLAVSAGLVRRREAALREGLAANAFGPGAVRVEGHNGPAFVIQGHGTWD